MFCRCQAKARTLRVKIVHGSQDAVLPLENSEKLCKVWNEQGIQTEVQVLALYFSVFFGFFLLPMPSAAGCGRPAPAEHGVHRRAAEALGF